MTAIGATAVGVTAVRNDLELLTIISIGFIIINRPGVAGADLQTALPVNK